MDTIPEPIAPALKSPDTTTEESNAAAIIRTARQTVPPTDILVEGRKVGITMAGDCAFWNLDRMNPTPARLSGTTKAFTVNSFLSLVLRHGIKGATTIYCDASRLRIWAVINDHHADGTPGWRDHLITLQLERSRDLLDWLKLSTYTDQLAFAEFLENHAHQVTQPDSATMLEMVLQFHATQSGSVTAKHNIRSGSAQLQYEADSKVVSVELPRELQIAVPLHEHGERVPVTAQFRYRIREGKPMFQLVFADLRDREERAWDSIVDEITEVGKDELLVVSGEPVS